jgi:hypothetical protein
VTEKDVSVLVRHRALAADVPDGVGDGRLAEEGDKRLLKHVTGPLEDKGNLCNYTIIVPTIHSRPRVRHFKRTLTILLKMWFVAL